MRRHKPHVSFFRTFDSFGCAIYLVYFCFMPFNFYLLAPHTRTRIRSQPSLAFAPRSPRVRFTVSLFTLFAFAACAPSIDLYQYPSTISLCNIPVEPIGSSNKNCIKNELNLFALIKIAPTHSHSLAHTHTHKHLRVTNYICGNSFGLFITLFMIYVSLDSLKYNQKTISNGARLA